MKYDERFIDGIIDILRKNKALKRTDVDALKEDFKNRSDVAFEFFLIDENITDKEALLQALQEYYQVPALDVEGEFFDHHLLVMFPKDVLLRYCFIPYERDGVTLVIIASNPENPDLLDAVGRYVSYDVTLMVGYCTDIEEQIEEYYDKAVTEEPTDQDLREERAEEHEVEEMEEGEDIRRTSKRRR